MQKLLDLMPAPLVGQHDFGLGAFGAEDDEWGRRRPCGVAPARKGPRVLGRVGKVLR